MLFAPGRQTSCLAVWVLVCACGAGPVESKTQPGGAGSSSAGGNGTGGSRLIDRGPDLSCDPSLPGSPCAPDAPGPLGCGDGILTEDEACDDGNRNADDGCRANCLGVDAGYSCNPPGEPCHELAVCGDGILGTSEQCDDGNVSIGDGCSARCHFELGYKCDGSPSVCSATTCGDAVKEGAESCDDGNTQPFDGCSAHCQAEPTCTAAACSSACGDGLLIDEACDDGNTEDGDGCSSACAVEPGFVCSQDAECERVDGKCVLRVPAIFRDFNQDHSDFEEQGCGSEVATTGIVQQELGAAGKPLLAAAGPNACIASAASLAEWYTNTANNVAIVSELVLFDNGGGGFVNRWGPDGQQWLGETGTPYDGNPFFFPLEDQPAALTDTRFAARVGPDYGFPNVPLESEIVAGAGLRNFHFTTEVKYWFKYDAAKAATLDFTGDDDVWVFVNGKLAVDLGGLHPPESGSVTVEPATAARYGLKEGKVYAITIFHAERKAEGSSFRLTLDGFNTARSECSPVCGDGIVSLGEQCDDGVNDGGYGECAAGCVIGAYCGDGILQAGEQCDDGNRLDGDSCGSACRKVVVK